jgi:lysophospholipase L1-like esterase
MRRLVSILAAAVLTVTLAGPVAAAPGTSDDHAIHYYLSLGDSLAASYQPTGDPADMYRTDEGYTDQLYGMARSHFAKLRHIKLGCPGETTVTFMQGGICDYEYGSQLAQAVDFLHAHGKFVEFVTIDLGWNDFPCQDSEDCILPGALQIAANLPTILAALRAAAPDVQIVGATIYDPFLPFWLQGTPEGIDIAQRSVPAVQAVNDLEELIYGSFGIPVADVEGAFSTTDWTPVDVPWYPFPVPTNVATICALTWICSAAHPGDFHANATGYGVMALAFRAKLGF